MASSQAKASEEPPGSCNLNVIDPITVSEVKVPVILVHGYTGSPDDWSGNKISVRINDLPGTEVAQILTTASLVRAV